MTATYVYDPDGLVDNVTYGNGASVWYTYDEARRLKAIEHRDGLVVPQVIRRLVYDYDARDLPLTITEYDQVGPVAMVSFVYDNRGRLTDEARYTETPYELHYEYDQGGNRTEKLDTVNDVKVEYHYDTANPLLYQSNNNRLEYYETYDTFGTPDPLDDVLLSTTWYYYNASGNATWIVMNQEGATNYSATRMIYAKNGQTVSLMVNETWTWDGVASCPAAYTIAHAREYRYDGGRQRYLDRVLKVADLMEGNVNAVEDGDTWTDYDGDEPYGDYTVDSGFVFNARSFELGVATVDPWTDEDGMTTSYYHTDMIGTTRHMTDESGNAASSTTYTAFGERVDGSNDRYGYAGAWGYQSHDDFPFLHVGARYYDASTGRFLQRDPIGIAGGPNVYEYVGSVATIVTDPSGLISMSRSPVGVRNRIRMGWGGLGPPPTPGNDPNDPRVRLKYAGEDPVGHTKEELDAIKKDWMIIGGEAAVLAPIQPAGWVGVVACALTALIDAFWYYDEPVNPVFGGDYQ